MGRRSKPAARAPKEPEKHQEAILAAIGGALAFAQLLLSQSAEFAMPWWLSGLLSLASFIALAIAIRMSAFRRSVRILATAFWLVIAFGLWQATSPHAKLRIKKVEMAQTTRTANNLINVNLNIHIENIGNYSATAAYGGATKHLKERMTEQQIREVEDELYDAIKKELSDGRHTTSELDVGDELFFSVRFGPFTDEQFKDVQDKKVALFVVAMVRFTDWWFWPRHSSVCQYTTGDAVVRCSRFNRIG
jgi:hypothetical protein